MSAPAAPIRDRARRSARTSALPRRLWVIDVGLVVAFGGVAAVAAWPIYRDPWMYLTVGIGVVTGVAIAVLAARSRWSWWIVALATVAAYLVLGIPLGAPRALTDLSELPAAVVDIATAPVTGWKNILTLDVPLGTYQAVLAPLLLVCLLAPVIALSTAWRTRHWVFAAPLALTMPVFGIVFGSSAVRGILEIGPVTVPGVVELSTGLFCLLACVGWFVWRTNAARSLELRTAETATGVRAKRPRGAATGKWLLAGAMATVATVVGLVVAPLAVAGQVREVPRTVIAPELRIRSELSPLITYRENFDDDIVDTELFRITTDSSVDRVRLATLSFYDGVVARVLAPDGLDPLATAFVRLPTSSGAGTVRSVIEIGAYSGIWVPITAGLTSVGFSGADRNLLADGFFFSPTADMGVQLSDPGLAPGVSISQPATLAAADVQDPLVGEPRLDEDVIPDSLTQWLELQDVADGYDGLVTLIERLRARGYLSHALTIDEDVPPLWMTQLDDYSFEPSRAGHSTDRIGSLFSALNERQNDVGGNDDALLVAAVGDDEQFAVAAALIADRLGFESRVVLGARLHSEDDTLSVCEDGSCVGGDIAAWIEIRDTAGGWIPIDTTPQHANPIAPEIDQRNDPPIPTDVRPQQADAVPPPDASPADAGTADDTAAPESVDLSDLWAALRVSGSVLLVLFILLGPLLAIITAKTVRRRSRRHAADPADRVIAGWDEYVDAAVDRGLPLPHAQTRSELAALYDAEGTGAAVALASWADRSAFAFEQPTEAESDAFWSLVDAERAHLRTGLGWWASLRARISLRSFRRGIQTATAQARAKRAARPRTADTHTTRMTRTASRKEQRS